MAGVALTFIGSLAVFALSLFAPKTESVSR
jgi:hypothetical protein